MQNKPLSSLMQLLKPHTLTNTISKKVQICTTECILIKGFNKRETA